MILGIIALAIIFMVISGTLLVKYFNFGIGIVVAAVLIWGSRSGWLEIIAAGAAIYMLISGRNTPPDQPVENKP